jgi:hypothetical protein
VRWATIGPVPQPLPVGLRLDGPTFEGAVSQTRDAATSVIHGSPAAGESMVDEFLLELTSLQGPRDTVAGPPSVNANQAGL